MDDAATDESIPGAIARIERTLRNRCAPENGCVIAVAARSAAEVLSGFRVAPDTASVAPHLLPSDWPTVSLLEGPDGVVAVQDRGFEGVDPATLHRLSRGTRAASLMWNGMGDLGFGFAVDGLVLDGPDNIYPTGDQGMDPEVVALFAGLDPAVHGDTACGLLAIERFTGVRIDGPPLAEPALVHPLPSPPGRLRPALGAVTRATIVYDGDEDRSTLSAAVTALPPPAQRRLAALAATTAIRLARMGSPDLTEAVQGLTDLAGPRFSEPVEIELLRAGRAEATGRATLRSRVLRVLATAANPDPQLAALEALWAVREVLTPASRPAYDANVRQAIDAAARPLSTD